MPGWNAGQLESRFNAVQEDNAAPILAEALAVSNETMARTWVELPGRVRGSELLLAS